MGRRGEGGNAARLAWQCLYRYALSFWHYLCSMHRLYSGCLPRTSALPSITPPPPPAGITESGFRFLLADMYAQLWGVVKQYLADLQGAAGGASLAVAVNFLLRLGLQAGQAMAYAQLDDSERAIAAHMAQLGLLMPHPDPASGGVWLHPTRMAAVLAGAGRAGEAAAAAEDGYAIVESNFRWVGGWVWVCGQLISRRETTTGGCAA